MSNSSEPGKSSTFTDMAPTPLGQTGLSAERLAIQAATGKDSSPVNYRKIFFDIADQGIKAGKITQDQVEIIYRPKSRKQNYWARHIRDLVSILSDRGYEAKFPDPESMP